MAATIRVFPDAEALCQAAAAEFLRLGADSIVQRGAFRVALSGGSTPKRLFQILAEPARRSAIDWNKVDFFWGDERALEPTHVDSNFCAARSALLEPLGVAAARIHRMPAERVDREAAAADYQREMAAVFGVPADGPPPALDLALLGMGPDAHTASLFPGTAALEETRRWVVSNYVPKFTAYRLTLTAPALNAARVVLFLAAGADKAAPLAEVLEGPRDVRRLPSQLIEPVGSLVWFLDESAAARLAAVRRD